MKLLQINAVYGYGSTAIIMEDIHKMCLKTGIDSHVAYSTSPLPESDIPNGYQIGRTFGKKTHALLCRVNGKQAYFSSYATKKFLRYIEKLSPDIVHLHNLHSNYLNLNMLLDYLAKKNIATVLTLHDCWFFTGGCFHYTEAQCERWTEQCGNCPKKRTDTPAYWGDCSTKILRDRKKHFKLIQNLTTVGVSDWIASEAKKTFLAQSDVRTIYNGVDLDFFKNTPSNIRRQLGIGEDTFVVLGMANKWLLPDNRNALLHLTSSLPDHAMMLIVGCTGKQKKHLPANVLGIGYIKDRQRLRDIYSTANVFVNCTREDSLPFANMEPQACGLPVITYCNTGAKETVDEFSSFSVEDGNYRAMTDLVLQMITSDSSLLAENCRAFINNRFNMVQNYQKYLDLYFELFTKKACADKNTAEDT